MITQEITQIDSVPLRSNAVNESDYRQKVEVFLLAVKRLSEELGVAIPEMNTLLANVNAKEQSAISAAQTATQKAEMAAAAAQTALQEAGNIENIVLPEEATYSIAEIEELFERSLEIEIENAYKISILNNN